MGTTEIRRPAAPVSADAAERPHPRRGVVIVYEGRLEGRAALRYAHSLAADHGVSLTVVTVASRQRTDIGCGACRQGAMFHNQMACEFATAELREARDAIPSGSTNVAVDYVLARGAFAQAVARTAADHHADLVVLPARRRGRLRRMVSRDRAKRLSRLAGAAVQELSA